MYMLLVLENGVACLRTQNIPQEVDVRQINFGLSDG